MNSLAVVANIFIFTGAIVMAFSIYKFRALLRLLNLPTFMEEYNKLRKSFLLHQSLMSFFLLGYIIVFFAIISGSIIMSNFFVGIIFLLGAIYVLLNILLQRNILNSLKFKYMQSMSISRRLNEEQANLKKTNELLRNEIAHHKQDIIKKSRLENQLRQSQKMEAIGKLAGGIAHDFNNMLGGISGFAELIKLKYGKDNLDLGRYVDTILDTSSRATDLIAQLLAFARKGKYQIVAVDMHTTIKNVIHLIAHTFDRRIEIIDNLLADSFKVMGDSNQLQNIVFNLTMNSRDAMPTGGVLRLSTKSVKFNKEQVKSFPYKVNPGAYFELTVTDTGVGMDKETVSRVFEPFFTTKDVGEGSGLGLSSVYGTVKNHDGFIEVSSETGQGTTVQVYLPLVEKTAGKIIKHDFDISDYSGNILLIDDDEILREVTGEMFRQLKFGVISCSNGEEAIEYYRTNYNEIDLVFIDIIMPKIGGYDCFIRLKEIDPDIKAIVISGQAMNEEAGKMIAKGALPFVRKPFNMNKLSRVIYDALSTPTPTLN